jgi:hypothetical protein
MRLRGRDDNDRIDAGMGNCLFDIREGNFGVGEDFAALGGFSIRVRNCDNSHPAQSHQVSQVGFAHAPHSKKGDADRACFWHWQLSDVLFDALAQARR